MHSMLPSDQIKPGQFMPQEHYLCYDIRESARFTFENDCYAKLEIFQYVVARDDIVHFLVFFYIPTTHHAPHAIHRHSTYTELDYGDSLAHIHVHLFPGRGDGWPKLI